MANTDIEVFRDKTILPQEKKGFVDILLEQVEQLNKDIKEKKLSGTALELAKKNQEGLQGLIDKFLQKKGVITPIETNEALELLNESKKYKLEEDFIKTKSKFEDYIFIGLVLALSITAAFLLIKKEKT
jgi:hypothetical protein